MKTYNLPKAKNVSLHNLKMGSISIGQLPKEESSVKKVDSLHELEEAVKKGAFENDISNHKNEEQAC